MVSTCSSILGVASANQEGIQPLMESSATPPAAAQQPSQYMAKVVKARKLGGVLRT
jgi:hypothetical protein